MSPSSSAPPWPPTTLAPAKPRPACHSCSCCMPAVWRQPRGACNCAGGDGLAAAPHGTLGRGSDSTELKLLMLLRCESFDSWSVVSALGLVRSTRKSCGACAVPASSAGAAVIDRTAAVLIAEGPHDSASTESALEHVSEQAASRSDASERAECVSRSFAAAPAAVASISTGMPLAVACALVADRAPSSPGSAAPRSAAAAPGRCRLPPHAGSGLNAL